MFQYSPRPGTEAATMPDQVPKDVVGERFDRLLVLQERHSLARSQAQLGSTAEVLVEGGDEKGLSTRSRTRTNRIVHLPTELPPGTFVSARIVSAAPHHLGGELLSEPAPLGP
jgi:tRNA-2-methylthio-N6-dimethylallyladenosine synthase